MSLPVPAGATFLAPISARLALVRDAGGTPRVLKRLSSRMRGEPLAERMFATEVAMLERLPPGLGPALIAHGVDAAGPWLLEEYLAGADLAAWVARWGVMPEPMVAQLFERGEACLQRLHAARDEHGALGMLHGDVAPTNLLLGPDLELFLIDFDLGSLRGAEWPRDGRVRGTLSYLSPKVARGERPGPDDDRFALAACMIFALTGAPPRAEHGPALLVAAGSGPPPLPPLADRELERALLRALHGQAA